MDFYIQNMLSVRVELGFVGDLTNSAHTVAPLRLSTHRLIMLYYGPVPPGVSIEVHWRCLLYERTERNVRDW